MPISQQPYLHCNISLSHSFIPAISIAPLQSPLLLRGAPDYSTDTLSEFHETTKPHTFRLVAFRHHWIAFYTVIGLYNFQFSFMPKANFCRGKRPMLS